MTTGISAEQRCNMVRALANGNMGASDFVRPGHVFPLIARDGGVLMRSGHTEAAVDLCKLAGLPPVGVICELANDDGTVMVGPQIEASPPSTSLARISVADLIAYRQAREKLVERVATFPVKTPIGELDRLRLSHAASTPCCISLSSTARSATGAACRRACTAPTSSPIFSAPASSRACCSASRTRGAASRLSARRRRRASPSTSAAPSRQGSDSARARQWREVGLGAQILRDLGVILDPPAHREPEKICRPFGLRHRDRRDRGDRRLRRAPKGCAPSFPIQTRLTWPRLSRPSAPPHARRAAAEALEVVTAFEQRDDRGRRSARSASAISVARRPGEIGLAQVEIAERIAIVRVEPRRRR